MKLKQIIKCLLLIFLYCNENREISKLTKKPLSQEKHSNSKRLKKLQCDCQQPTPEALCPKQQTRPANHTEYRQKLQGRKPKFKLATTKSTFANNGTNAAAAPATLMMMKAMTSTKIDHLTAKAAGSRSSGSSSSRSSSSGISSDGDGDVDVDAYLRQQLNGDTVAPPQIFG